MYIHELFAVESVFRCEGEQLHQALDLSQLPTTFSNISRPN
jgi:hypothetical protein